MLQNLFGDLALDTTLKAIIQRLGRLSFSPSSGLRVAFESAQPVTVSSGTISYVGQSNTSFGLQGVNSAAQIMSATTFYSSVGRNFIRS